MNLSSTVTLVIQKNIMASHVLMVFEFDPTNIPAGYFLDSGWGFLMVRRIQMQYGGSEILEIDGHDNFLRAINECENDRKKSAMIANAGQYSTFTGGVYYGTSPKSGSAGIVYRAVVPIILPHSSTNAFRQLPFDVSCLNQSVNIRVTLADSSFLWQWAGIVTEAPPAMVAQQSTLSFGEFVVGQQMLIDTIASKKDLVSGMGPNSNYQLNYFFKYPQHNENIFTVPSVNNDANVAYTTTTNGAINLTLTGWRNGALDSIVLWVERIGPYNSARSAAQSLVMPASMGLGTITMSNITVNYAGTQIYRSESNELAQALDYMINTTDSTYDYAPAYRTGAAGATTLQAPERNSYIRIQLAQFSEVLFAGGLIQAAGALLSNDTLQLSFDITDYFGLSTAATAAGINVINYRLNVEQLYSSSVVIERGTARFGFTNPMGQPQIPFNNI